jgi:hypothetical protein
MVKKREYKLDLIKVLNVLDNSDKLFFDQLTTEEKNAYAPVVLMRYMSSLGDQNMNKYWAILATNDLVNIGFWTLSKYPDLQHLLLCITGTGKKQYRPWIAASSKKRKTNKLDMFWYDMYPDINNAELNILKMQYSDINQFKKLIEYSGLTDQEIKELLVDFKKQSFND